MAAAEVGPRDQDGEDGLQVVVEAADFPEVAAALAAVEVADPGKVVIYSGGGNVLYSEAFATISGIVKNKFVLSPHTAIFDASFKPHFHK